MKPPPPRPAAGLTSAEAAALLGVGASSVKRWSGTGELRCHVTAGGHRRFARADVEAFARRRGHSKSPASEADPLVEALLSERPVWALQAEILERRARAGSWCEAADAIARACAEIGERWAGNEITILDEHRASERLARAIAACAETFVPTDSAPRALLAVAEGDEHTLALRLAELCLRGAGWNVEWAGSRSPTDEVVGRIERGGVDLVALSASESSSDPRVLAKQLRRVHAACLSRGTRVVVGGRGAWPPAAGFAGDLVHRVESLRELDALLDRRSS